MSLDRIERYITLRAARSRVWRALTNAEEFGTWFGVVLKGQFVPGECLAGRFTAPGHTGEAIEFVVERIEPEHLFAYRWHPYANEPGVDVTPEPTTLVEFHLRDTAEGTHLTVIESGFGLLTPARRASAFPRHDQGWAEQLARIADYVAA
jgi:uncharacterized protein YndB with AHSA1/START domain